jgi:hypothetical protein
MSVYSVPLGKKLSKEELAAERKKIAAKLRLLGKINGFTLENS